MASSSRNLDVVGRKTHTTLSGVANLIISEVVQEELTRARKLPLIKANCIYFEGTMGIGKSQATQQAVKLLTDIVAEVTGVREEFGLTDLRLAGMTGSDIQGIPIPVKDGGGQVNDMGREQAERVVLKWVKDEMLPGISKTGKKKGLLFLDELNQVEDNSVRSLLYQLILDKKINDYVIPEGWYIVAAGNREEDGGVYNRLPAPVRDRMMIVEVDLSKQEWIDNYARPYRVHPAVITFLQNDNKSGYGYLHTYDPEKENDGDEECENYVFATPRSWVAVSDALKAYENPAINIQVKCRNGEKLISTETVKTKICGLIGDDLGLKFFNYYVQTRDCNVEEIVQLQWSNGQPDHQVRISEENLVYLTNLAVYPTDDTIDSSIKILLYLTVQGTSSTGVEIILNSYTESQNKRLTKFCVDTGNSSKLTSLGEYSKQLRDIIAVQNSQREISLGKH